LLTSDSRSQYNKAAARCRRSTRAFVAESERRLIDKGNIGLFYRYANKHFCSKSSIGPIVTSDNNLTTDPVQKAEIFNKTFSSHFVQDNGALPNSLDIDKLPNCIFDDVIFTATMVCRAIKRLKTNSKGGPDNIPPIFYKHCNAALNQPLSMLFSLCFSHSYLPPVWLTANIVPIFKKGIRTDPNNYRPVALTCTACKLMESIIKDQLLSFLVDNKLISPHQHAFIHNHSTASNLLECIHDWLVSLNSSRSTDVIYVDFSRAFDSIVFSKLLFKLKFYGIAGNLLNWIDNFLHNRSQCVVIDNHCSSPSSVISGVPQGSVLGPILFLLFINDLDHICCSQSHLKLFADDSKLYSEITNRLVGSLQQCLDRLCLWAREWQISINVSKCYSLTITSSRSSISNHVYFINNIPISASSTVTDLGINIAADLSFRNHIECIVAKSYQRLSVLFRGFVTRDIKFIRKAYVSFIRPILEYNSIVWSPTEIYLIDLLEGVQRYFTRNIPALSDFPYLIRIAKTDLTLLELRRLRFDLTYYFKILNNLTPHNPSEFFILYHPPLSSRSPSAYLQKPIKGSNKFRSFLSFRSVAAWNSLSDQIRSLDSVISFKKSLISVDFSKFLVGNASK
jgi:hypothetical protein